MDLLDLLAEMEREEQAEPPEESPEAGSESLPLCRCLVAKATGADGWTLERDRESVYYGMWVHAQKGCRMPRHPHTSGIQIPLEHQQGE